MIKTMRVSGFLSGVGRVTTVSAVFVCVCLAGVSGAAVPEGTARQPVNTGEYRAVVDRLVRLERELNDLQRATYSRLAARRTGPNTATDGTYGRAPSGSDQQRINDLESSLRSLTGRLEELEYRVRQLNGRVERLADAMGRMQPGAGQPSAAAQPGSGPETGMPAGAGAPRNLAETMPPRSRSGSPMPGAGEESPGTPSGAPGTPPAPPSEPGSTGTQPGGAGPDTGQAEGSAGSSNSPKLSGDDGKDFNRARDLLLRGEFARAGDMFGAIAKAYPDSKLAGDSQFWKAESLYVRELYKDAAQAYLAVARDFPDSAKAPDSLVKLSLAFDKLGERKQACAALAQLDRRYPKAPEKVRQNAQRIKQEFACS